MKNLFDSATLRLTFWYMLILTVLSLLFSVIVYQIASQEFHRPYRPHTVPVALDDSGDTASQAQVITDQLELIREARETQAEKRLIGNLLIFNVATIAAGGLASYVLARRTLHPIAEALDAQTRFSSDVSHELRTPLAVMQSEIEIALRDKKPTVSSQKQTLESNLDEVQNLRALTDRLLMLSTEKELPLGLTSIDDVTTESINRVITLAQSKKISIENTVGKQTATANFEVLTDAVVILLDNAIKYSPSKSEITVAAKTHGKHVLLQVRDNGPGIASTDLPHIFDRFYRADTSRSKKNVEGHGLGLSIAKRSVEAMSGSLSVASSGKTGTTFQIKLHIGSSKS